MREKEREKERERVCLCVRETERAREKEKERKRENESKRARERKREREREREREKGQERECEREREREMEKAHERERKRVCVCTCVHVWEYMVVSRVLLVKTAYMLQRKYMQVQQHKRKFVSSEFARGHDMKLNKCKIHIIMCRTSFFRRRGSPLYFDRAATAGMRSENNVRARDVLAVESIATPC